MQDEAMTSPITNAVRALATALLLLAMAACGDPSGEPSPEIEAIVANADGPVTIRLPDGDTLVLSEPVVRFYRDRGYLQAWTDYDEILDRGWQLLKVMENAGQDGLDPVRYRFPVALSMVQQVEEDSLEEEQEPGHMAAVDLVLSEVFGRYANHLVGGVLDPSASGLDWEIPKDSVDTYALLVRLATDENPEAIIESLRPEVPEYHLLMDQLARYQRIVREGGWQPVRGEIPTDIGQSGAGVVELRNRLIKEGDAEEVRLAQYGAAAPTVYDDSLAAAVEHFQVRHALQPDGRVGASTLEQLNTSAEERVQQIVLNLDQWRWLPQNLGDSYILVNVAGFELEYIRDDTVALAMNVVVGQEGWETAIFADTMEHIVVNPYWNVPPSIRNDEVIPAIQRDPGYLSRNNMEALAGSSVVPASSIDFGNLEAYSFRQKPGSRNALGRVKFLFPNEHDIYLHDTPADQLFSAHSRAFSHGCIRLEKPLELARMLLDDVTDTPSSQLDEMLERDTEQWINLTEELPVYILYFTAWAGRDGTMRFYPDIYERDRRLQEQVEQELRMDPRTPRRVASGESR